MASNLKKSNLLVLAVGYPSEDRIPSHTFVKQQIYALAGYFDVLAYAKEDIKKYRFQFAHDFDGMHGIVLMSGRNEEKSTGVKEKDVDFMGVL